VTPHHDIAPLGSQPSLWPPVMLSAVTEMCIRGPTRTPSSTAFLRPRSAPPASRTVVIHHGELVAIFVPIHQMDMAIEQTRQQRRA
jgi:hypothetical protein